MEEESNARIAHWAEENGTVSMALVMGRRERWMELRFERLYGRCGMAKAASIKKAKVSGVSRVMTPQPPAVLCARGWWLIQHRVHVMMMEWRKIVRDDGYEWTTAYREAISMCVDTGRRPRNMYQGRTVGNTASCSTI